MSKSSDEVYDWVEFDWELDEVILKPYGRYVITAQAVALDKSILTGESVEAEIMTLKEWYAQVND